jgi:type III pantothenate kinase
MDINLMAINVGNSRLAVGMFAAGELVHTARWPLDQSDDLPAKLAQAWATLEGHTPIAVAGACVNPDAKGLVEQAIDQAIQRRIDWVGHELDLPIHVATDKPSETGVDRVLNVAAAFEQMEHACVVVDAGTALTVDCCNDLGEFVGGAIAPGVSMMFNALHAGTAQLPLVPFAVPQGMFGRSTQQAILHGIYHGIRGMVKELAENYATELGAWPEIIATGGDAQLLFGGWDLIHAIAPDLTLYGIALAYSEHHIKHGT